MDTEIQFWQPVHCITIPWTGYLLTIHSDAGTRTILIDGDYEPADKDIVAAFSIEITRTEIRNLRDHGLVKR